MRNGIAGLALILAVLWVVAPAEAQELTSGTIDGKVTDPTGRAIAGAVIITTSQSGTRTAETDADGAFILPFLRPGTYTVRVEAPGGFNTVIHNDVVVALNQRTHLKFTLEPGKTETVTVTGRSPLVDPKSTSSGTNVKYDEFANAVPLGRSFTDTYAVAAGVVGGLGTGEGNYSISGASGLENMYLIDGVNITNTGFGGIGVFNYVFGSLGTGVTSEFLDEVQIKTGGFEAEYGQAMGGIINTIVKSGTNELKGTVAYYGSPKALQSSRQRVELDTGTTNKISDDVHDFAFSVGGPFVKDKLFYFFAYNPVMTTHQLRAQSLTNPAFAADTAGVPAFDESLAEGFAAPGPLAFPSAGGELERKRQANNYAAKLSWAVSPKHNLELTFFGDPAQGDAGPQRASGARYSDFASGGGFSEIKYGSHNQTLKWTGVFTPKFFMEAQIARHDGKFRETSTLNEHNYADLRNVLEFFRGADSYDPGGGPVPLEIDPVQTLRGGVGFITNQNDENTQFSVKATNILGPHEIKYGVQRDDIEYSETPRYTGPSFDITLPTSDPGTGFPDGGTIIVPSRGGAVVNVRNSRATTSLAYDGANIFRVIRAQIGPKLPPTTAEDLSLFVQDTWSIHPRVTVKAGVRWTQETIEGAGEFTLPFGTQVFTDPVTSVSHRIYTPGTSSYTPDSYTFSGNWAPRVGVTWDILGTGKSRAWANWGRYFERVPNDLAVRALSNEVGISRQQFTDRDLTTWDGGQVFTQGIDESNVVAGVKLPYEDELSGGFAFEVTPNSSFEVRAIYRTQGRALEDVQVNSVESIQNFYYGTGYGYYPYDPFPGFTSAVFGAYELANPGTKQVPAGGDFPKPVRRYKALELIYTKRFSDNWSLFANYRFARLIGNYEGLFRNDNGQPDPNITSLYDFPNTPLMSGQFGAGPLPADVSHVLHIFPSYTFANKLRVGANFSWASGVPRTSLLAHPVYQNAGEIPGINPVYAYWADPDLDPGGPCLGANCTLKTTKSLKEALADPDLQPFGGPFLFSYDPVKRGNLGRTPDLVTLDLGVDYPLDLGKTKLTLRLDLFNVFKTQEITAFNDNVELTAGVTDPDFLKALAYETPRSWRASARWDF